VPFGGGSYEIRLAGRLSDSVLSAVHQLGLDGLRFHDLRHTAATSAAAAGATTRELMARMGHTSPAVALR
jgi:integrase